MGFVEYKTLYRVKDSIAQGKGDRGGVGFEFARRMGAKGRAGKNFFNIYAVGIF